MADEDVVGTEIGIFETGIVIDRENDSYFNQMVSEAMDRMNSPTGNEKKNRLEPEQILMRYMTQEAQNFRRMPREKLMQDDGSYRLNRNFSGGQLRQEIARVVKTRTALFRKYGSEVPIGLLIKEGDACLGQALFASVVFEELGIPNAVIKIDPRDGVTDDNPFHALVAYNDSKGNVQYFDSMWGKITPEKDVEKVYSNFDKVSIVREA